MMKNGKVITCVISIILTILFTCKNKGVNEVYILPNDFNGPVIVIFNNANGVAETLNYKGDRILEIPSSGLLKTKSKFQEGWRDIKYFRKNGIELKYLWPDDILWNDTLNKNKINDTIYVYRAAYADDYWFLVGKIQDLDSLSNEMSSKWIPLSKPVKLKEGDSVGKVRHNSAF